MRPLSDHHVLALIATLMLSALRAPGAVAESPVYLETDGGYIKSANGVDLWFEMPQGMRPIGTQNHSESFQGGTIGMTMAGFVEQDVALVIVAERAEGKVDPVDYRHFDTRLFEGIEFISDHGCTVLGEEDVEAIVELKFVVDNGFEPFPALYLQRYRARSPQGSAETIVSYVTRVDDCTLVDDSFRRAVDEEADRRINALRPRTD